MCTPKGVYLFRIFLKCFLKSIYPNKVAKKFKFVVLRLLKDAFVSRKTESVHFCSYPQAKRSPRQKEIMELRK